ncbi:uncharacterized protein LOC107039696 [Diachasma alloeum]|uniref:uncharacterized protein LOC107039696 n=1 Tax=Diachasma alloeum TaxID=454923 RepID=UPI0007381E5D|nr:uncharacterized protein LOC107039696 [Diachasma alloeum]
MKHQDAQAGSSGLISRAKGVKGGALAAKGENSKDQRKSGKGKGSGHPKRSGEGNDCHKEGHWEYECREKLKDLSKRYEDGKKGWNARGGALMTHLLASIQTSESPTENWYLGSAASSHMSSRRDWFANLKYLNNPERIVIGDGKVITGVGRDNINILAYNGEKWVEKHIQNTLYVPELKFNLFSTAAATDEGLEHGAANKSAWFKKNGQVVALGIRKRMSWKMKLQILTPQKAMTTVRNAQEQALISPLKTWHERLAHQNFQHIQRQGVRPRE